MIGVDDFLGCRDVLFITFDTLRYDVAVQAMRAGQTPNLQKLLPGGIWQERHTPGSFTYAAHHAFFAGFLPTPIAAAPHERLFALDFPGSETTGARTCVFDTPDIISGFRGAAYHTACIGGVGFFNKQTPLGRVLPGMFDESTWRPEFGVTDRDSPTHQLNYAAKRSAEIALNQRLFLFLNLSAMHQPNCHYMKGMTQDTPDTQAAALGAVDKALGAVMPILAQRKWLCIFTSDHGTTYGEAGYTGHRLAHEQVWRVPYAEFLWG